MHGWEVLIVPILIVASWIIRTVMQNAEAAKQAGGKKPEKVTDLDRFLREVNRRRKTAEREEERPRRAERTEERPRRAERRPAQSRAKWSTPPAADVPVALAVEPVATAPVMAVLEAAPLPAMPADMSAPSLPPRPESAALVGIRALLRSRDGLRKAMILREVLGPPVSRRR
jgi:hypothetical protein